MIWQSVIHWPWAASFALALEAPLPRESLPVVLATKEVLHFYFVLYGRLLDKNAYCVETLRDLSDPAVLPQSGESRRNGLIQRLCRDIDGVLDVFEIGYGNFARSKHYAMRIASSPFIRYNIFPLGSPLPHHSLDGSFVSTILRVLHRERSLALNEDVRVCVG